jgi:hypothetical protein
MNPTKSTHSQQLERWIGIEQIENISRAMHGFYGGPIPLANAGNVWATPDGDFVGKVLQGSEACINQRLFDMVRREERRRWRHIGQRTQQLGGFSSVGDLISEMTTGGKAQLFNVAKAGVTGVANIANNLWEVGALPPAGTITSATEFVTTNTTVGGLQQTNAAGGDSLHFISATMSASVATQTLLMHDLYWYYCHNIATQSPTGLSAGGNLPTRYQDTTAKGNIATAFVTTALGGTVGNYQLTYVDQDGNTAETNTTQALVSASIARRFPFATSVGNGWFIPINAGDLGPRKITAVTQSVGTGTGVIQLMVSKPLVWIPMPATANLPVLVGGVTSAINMAKIIDNACLAFLEINKSATTATNYSGQIVLCSG